MQKKILNFILIYFLSNYIITVIIPFAYIFLNSTKKEIVVETHSPMIFENSKKTSSELNFDYFRLYDNSTKKTSCVPYRDFLIGSLAYEMDLSVPKEAMKAQVVATYTYYLYIQSQSNNYDVLWDSLTGYNYYNDEYLKELWAQDYEKNLKIITECVDEVLGQTIVYDDSLACSAYFPVSNGQTESANNIWGQDYDYLQVVASPYDKLSSSYCNKYKFSPEKIEQLLSNAWQNAKMDFTMNYKLWFDDILYTTGETVNSVNVCGYGVTGNELRTALSLPSPSFSITFDDEEFIFTCKGQGDGVGMSQVGATYMANDGATYDQILMWYYPGIILCD